MQSYWMKATARSEEMAEIFNKIDKANKQEIYSPSSVCPAITYSITLIF